SSSTASHCCISAGSMTCSSASRPPVCAARRAAYCTATRCSSVSSTTTRKTRGCALSDMARGPRCGSDAAERQAREPSCHQGAQHCNRAVGGGLACRKIGDLGINPNLRDHERRRLAADDVAIANQEDLDDIGPGRHVGGKCNRGAEEAFAEERDLAGICSEQPVALVLGNQRRAETGGLFRCCRRFRLQ